MEEPCLKPSSMIGVLKHGVPGEEWIRYHKFHENISILIDHEARNNRLTREHLDMISFFCFNFGDCYCCYRPRVDKFRETDWTTKFVVGNKIVCEDCFRVVVARYNNQLDHGYQRLRRLKENNMHNVKTVF